MKEAHPDSAKIIVPCAHSRLAYVARHHVGLRDFGERFLKRACNGVFDQSLFQSDAQVADQKLDQILSLKRSRIREYPLEKRLLILRPLHLAQTLDQRFRFGESNFWRKLGILHFQDSFIGDLARIAKAYGARAQIL